MKLFFTAFADSAEEGVHALSLPMDSLLIPSTFQIGGKSFESCTASAREQTSLMRFHLSSLRTSEPGPTRKRRKKGNFKDISSPLPITEALTDFFPLTSAPFVCLRL